MKALPAIIALACLAFCADLAWFGHGVSAVCFALCALLLAWAWRILSHRPEPISPAVHAAQGEPASGDF